MAVQAYVLVTARPGTSKGIVGRMIDVKGVRAADACWGRPDIFLRLEAPDLRALSDIVLTKIQPIEGVESTDTHIVCEM